jgi:hypothetical protein
MILVDALDACASAGDEGDARAPAIQLVNERETQARCAAGDGDPESAEGAMR